MQIKQKKRVVWVKKWVVESDSEMRAKKTRVRGNSEVRVKKGNEGTARLRQKITGWVEATVKCRKKKTR